MLMGKPPGGLACGSFGLSRDSVLNRKRPLCPWPNPNLRPNAHPNLRPNAHQTLALTLTLTSP